jgi:prolycopene isomerase
MSQTDSGRVDYDVVIIGSGIGGLTAGAYLAKDGVRVLICEQNRKPGGCFASFKRKGYTFDAGIQGCEDLGILLPILRELDLLGRIDLRRSKLAYAFPDCFCPLEKIDDLELIYDHLKKAFPKEVRALDRIQKEAIELCRVMDAFVHAPNPMMEPPMEAILKTPRWLNQYVSGLRGLRRLIGLLKTPIDEYLSTFVRDQNLIRLLSAGYRGNPAALGMSFLYTMMDYCYPARGGVQAIPNWLAQSIVEKGGEVRYGTLVEKIVVEDGRAKGVSVMGGERIRARFIINNGDIRRTFSEMVPSGAVPEEYARSLQQSNVSESVFSVYLGVDMPPEEIPTQGCGHVFLMPTYEPPDLNEIDSNPDFYRRALTMMMFPTLHDGALAPKGKSVVILQCAASIRSLHQWGTRKGRPTKQYMANKREIAARLIANAERLIPDLSKRIELQIESTPFTLRRYTLNSDGAAVGWTYHPRETFRQGFKGLFGSSNTPIRNLYQVGHWTMSPGGAPAGLMTGKIVSSIVRHRLRWGL